MRYLNEIITESGLNMDTQNIEALQNAELTEQEDSLLYSITLSGKNLFVPCSVCSSMHPIDSQE